MRIHGSSRFANRPAATPLLLAAPLLLCAPLLSGCEQNIELFVRRGRTATDGAGAATGTGGTGGVPAFGGSFGYGGSSSGIIGFPSESELLALRFTILDKEPTGLGFQVRTMEFQTSSGPFPLRPLTPENGQVMAVASVSDTGGSNQDPYRAFDTDPQTHWGLREHDMPGWIQLQSLRPIPPPSSVFIDLHQQEFRAPRDFDIDGFDGKNWWTLLSIRDLESWAEPEDTTSWEAEQRTWQLWPTEQWQMR